MVKRKKKMVERLLTSESVSEGHPDKLADQISDALLDGLLSDDRDARSAIEVLIKTGIVIVAGEIRSSAHIEVEKLVRQTITQIGYDDPQVGFDGNGCGIINILGEQSENIAQGVDANEKKAQGAGDQGLMYGYATNETEELMPATILYAHRLMQQQAKLRHKKEIEWLRPDAKSQVTLLYRDGKPIGADTIVLSTQHDLGISEQDIEEAVKEKIIAPVFPPEWLSEKTKYLINPAGDFVTGGPLGDCGLTGRKIIVDTYGGMARHGGGAFSGKDPSKVDRSAAYGARYVAKNIVAAGLAERCEIQLSYAIGIAEPTSINIDTFNTGTIPEPELVELVDKNFDLTPSGLIEAMQLKNIQYLIGGKPCIIKWLR